MVLCSVDIVFISASLLGSVRELLKDNNLGLGPQKVVIGAIHNLTGPAYKGWETKGEEMTLSFRSLLESQLLEDKKAESSWFVKH